MQFTALNNRVAIGTDGGTGDNLIITCKHNAEIGGINVFNLTYIAILLNK